MSEIVKSEYNALGEDNNYKTHYFKTSADQVVGLGRLKETTYSVNDVVYTDSNLSVALKCTTAGTTSNTELDISGVNVGQSVEDGSVVWEVCNRTSDVTSVNGKTGDVVVDLENFPNVQEEVAKKANLGALSMPSNSRIYVSLAFNASPYNPPADGYMHVVFHPIKNGVIGFFNQGSGDRAIYVPINGNTNQDWTSVYVPVRKNANVEISSGDTSVVKIVSAYFIYAQSEV